MNVTKINLKELYDLKGGTLTAQCIDNPWDDTSTPFTRPAVIVVPGGGYWMVSRREAEPVGNYFLYAGFQVFILNYLCASDSVSYPEQLYELSASVDYVRKNAEKFHVDPERIYCVGFSAGGHLVGNLAVEYQNTDTVLGTDSRPKAICLSYPVISADYGHVDSFNNLLQGYNEADKAKLTESLKLDKRVTATTPPCFIWTTAEDDCVPPINAINFAGALANNNVKFELHVYPQGWHGTSVSTEEINRSGSFLKKNSRWIKDCADFFNLIK